MITVAVLVGMAVIIVAGAILCWLMFENVEDELE